ncbi:MAG: succinate dehydrogenase iron-sulfur subunit [Dehalococcoidia bacterium]|nr:succinate dehydrogenase iron-sulfur subunit [Dehalococcoidia bacterium]MDD5494317.1 succinate dehydrogenase iron-sulfur subunit [Dehalococcoidia bacterium]
MSGDAVKNIIFRVQRYNPEKDERPHFEEFTVPVKHGTTVLEGLLYIKENLDSSLAFRTSCRMGICGSCGMLVNNNPHLACHTQVEEFHSNKLTLKPLPNLPIIKDLVPDLTTLFEKHRSVKPYIIRPDEEEMEKPAAEFTQKQKELDEFLQFTYCIKCGLCIAACPTSASDKKFLGPQALGQAFRYCADSRDAGQDQRLAIVDAEHGLWNCHFAAACSEACPKGVDPAFAIQLLRRRVVGSAIGAAKAHTPAGVVAPQTETRAKVPVPEFTVKPK